MTRNVLEFARLERRTFVAELQQLEVNDLLDELEQSVTDRVGPGRGDPRGGQRPDRCPR